MSESDIAGTVAEIDTSMSRFLDMLQSVGSRTADLIDRGWDYAEVQLTETVRQFLVWEFASACIIATTSFIGMLLIWIFSRSQIVHWRTEYKNENSLILPMNDYDNTSAITLATSSLPRFVVSILLCCSFIYVSNSFVYNVQKGAKIALAPRIYLLEYGVQKYKEIKTPTK